MDASRKPLGMIHAMAGALALALLFGAAGIATAQTADGETPADETVCDNETGALKGLCNAFCEAMDCHLNEAIHASQTACDRVLANYHRKSDGIDPPCLHSGCAATATAAGDNEYFACLEEPQCNEKSCAERAQRAFRRVLEECVKECGLECKVAFSACLEAAGTDRTAIEICKQQNTECTETCMGSYAPPAATCDGDGMCLPPGARCSRDEICCSTGTFCNGVECP